MDYVQIGSIALILGSFLVAEWFTVRGAKNAIESATIEAESFAIDVINQLKQEAVEAIPIVSSKVAESMKYSIMGKQSGDARLEKGMNEALVSDVVNQKNPMIGMIMDNFPQAKEYLAKNPNALPQILKLLERFGGGNVPSGDGDKGLLPLLKKLR